MTRFAAPIAESIWDMKYRFKDADGTAHDGTVEDTWRRIARALAAQEAQPVHWEDRFYAALEDFRFLPAGRITAGAGTGRKVTLFNCFVMGTIPDHMHGFWPQARSRWRSAAQRGLHRGQVPPRWCCRPDRSGCDGHGSKCLAGLKC